MTSKYFILPTIVIIFSCCLFSHCSKKKSTANIVVPLDTTAPPPLLPYKLVWADEFDSTGLPNPNKWGYDNGGGGWGNNELQYYTTARSQNARVENGILTIEAKKEAFSGSGYTSARLLTKNKAIFTYGKFEVRAKLPRGKGIWPAIWTLSANEPLRWPDDGELDIMESVGFNPNVIHGTAHSKSYNGANGKGGTVTIPTSQDSFHVYKMEWADKQIDWYVDNVKFYSYVDPGYGISAWPYNKDFFIILNIAVGGSWGGAQGIDDNIFPQQMLIDYVRVYQRK